MGDKLGDTVRQDRRTQAQRGGHSTPAKVKDKARWETNGGTNLRDNVASCWSSTTEGASDVSPFHLFHFAYCTCRSFVVSGCVCACCFLLCLVLCFACAAGIFLIIVADVSRWPTMLNRSFGCAEKKKWSLLKQTCASTLNPIDFQQGVHVNSGCERPQTARNQ